MWITLYNKGTAIYLLKSARGFAAAAAAELTTEKFHLERSLGGMAAAKFMIRSLLRLLLPLNACLAALHADTEDCGEEEEGGKVLLDWITTISLICTNIIMISTISSAMPAIHDKPRRFL